MSEESNTEITPAEMPAFINLRPHKPFVPPTPSPTEADVKVFVPDPKLLELVTSLVERVKSGEITAIAIAAIAFGYPMSSYGTGIAITIPELCVLNMAVDSCKDQVISRTYANVRYIGPDGEEIDEDELFEEEDDDDGPRAS